MYTKLQPVPPDTVLPAHRNVGLVEQVEGEGEGGCGPHELPVVDSTYVECAIYFHRSGQLKYRVFNMN